MSTQITHIIYTGYGEGTAKVYHQTLEYGSHPFGTTPSVKAFRIASIVPSESIADMLNRVHPKT